MAPLKVGVGSFAGRTSGGRGTHLSGVLAGAWLPCSACSFTIILQLNLMQPVHRCLPGAWVCGTHCCMAHAAFAWAPAAACRLARRRPARVLPAETTMAMDRAAEAMTAGHWQRWLSCAASCSPWDGPSSRRYKVSARVPGTCAHNAHPRHCMPAFRSFAVLLGWVLYSGRCSCTAASLPLSGSGLLKRSCPRRHELPDATPAPTALTDAALWAVQRAWLRHSLTRLLLGLCFLGALATAAANVWGLRALNEQLLPQAQAAAAVLLQREVQLGAVHWVSPLAGLLGLGPLASVGPISLGAGPVERSSARAERLWVGLDPVQSALQRRVVLAVKAGGLQVRGRSFPQLQRSAGSVLPRPTCMCPPLLCARAGAACRGWLSIAAPSSLYPRRCIPILRCSHPCDPPPPPALRPVLPALQLDLVQADNYSWFGYPEDTEPSARNFLPGSPGGGSGAEGSGGDGGSAGSGTSSSKPQQPHDGGSAAGGARRRRRSRSHRGAQPPALRLSGAATAEPAAPQQLSAPPAGSASASHQLQALVESLTRELLAKGAAAAAAVKRRPGQQTAQPSQDDMAAGGPASDVAAQQPQQVEQQVEPESVGQPEAQEAAMSLLGAGSAGSGTGSEGGLRRPAAEAAQGLARAAPAGAGGSGRGIFGGKISWGRAPAGPQQQQPSQPGAGPPPGSPQSRQQQLARLNAVRLQAGRGYTLLPAPAGIKQGPEAAGSAGEPAAAEAGSALPAMPTEEELKLAGHRSSLGPRSTEQQQQQQQQQHRRLHRWRGSLPPQQQQQQQKRQDRQTASATSLQVQEGRLPVVHGEHEGQQQALPSAGGPAAPLPTAATTDEAAAALAVAGSAPASMHSREARATRSPGVLPGSAASLNKHLSPLAPFVGSKLYSAKGPAHQPAAHAEGGGAAAVQQDESSATEASQTIAASAHEAEPAHEQAVPGMSAEQRQAAVAAINSLPGIFMALRRPPEQFRPPEQLDQASEVAGSAEGDGREPAAEAAPAPSPLTRRINSLGEQQAPDSLKPSARVSAAAANGGFAALVVDPATLQRKGERREGGGFACLPRTRSVAAALPGALRSRQQRSAQGCQVLDLLRFGHTRHAALFHTAQARAGGSASLPWAHQRPPAAALIGSRLGLGKPAARGPPEDAADAGAAAASVERAAAAAEVAASGEATFQLDAACADGGGGSGSSASNSNGQASGEAAPATGHRRVPLLHPGYFTTASGPSYTPAPPEALIDAREPLLACSTAIRRWSPPSQHSVLQ